MTDDELKRIVDIFGTTKDEWSWSHQDNPATGQPTVVIQSTRLGVVTGMLSMSESDRRFNEDVAIKICCAASNVSKLAVEHLKLREFARAKANAADVVEGVNAGLQDHIIGLEQELRKVREEAASLREQKRRLRDAIERLSDPDKPRRER